MLDKVKLATQLLKEAIVATGPTPDVRDDLNRFQRVLGIFDDVEDLLTPDSVITPVRPLPPEVIRKIEALGHPRVIRGSTAGQPRVNCG